MSRNDRPEIHPDAARRAASCSASPPTACGASFRSTSRRSPPSPAVDIVAHRVIWSLPFLACSSFSGLAARFAPPFGTPKTLGMLALTALLIGSNWLLYVYAVTSGHILAASFGYYLNPLANVLLGRFVLKERLSRLQWAAVAIAAAGISVLAAGALGQLWISLTLCASFALYGLLRKVVAVDALTGLPSKQRCCSRWRSAGLHGGRLAAPDVMGPTGTDTVLLLLAGRGLDDAAAAVHRRRPAAALIRPSACFSSSPRRCSS